MISHWHAWQDISGEPKLPSFILLGNMASWMVSEAVKTAKAWCMRRKSKINHNWRCSRQQGCILLRLESSSSFGSTTSNLKLLLKLYNRIFERAGLYAENEIWKRCNKCQQHWELCLHLQEFFAIPFANAEVAVDELKPVKSHLDRSARWFWKTDHTDLRWLSTAVKKEAK